MKLASVTVTYNSNPDSLFSNIDTYFDNVDLPIIWDNSPTLSFADAIIKKYPNTIILHDGQNHGLGEAYNEASRIAQQHGCTHIMTMDQDTEFDDFTKYRRWAEAQDCNILHCKVNDYHTTDNETESMETWCQSTSIFPISMLQQIGSFRSDYFIGMVDAEIGLRAAQYGYSVIQYNHVNAKHNVTPPTTRILLGHSIPLHNYPPFRHYYESRNRILIAKEYPNEFPAPYIRSFIFARLKLIIKITLFEKDAIKKISAIIRGTYNGLRCNTSPYKKDNPC